MFHWQNIYSETHGAKDKLLPMKICICLIPMETGYENIEKEYIENVHRN